MTKGLPASGKTTWAEEQVSKSNGSIKRVNKDDLRRMIDADKWSKLNEKHIVEVRNMVVQHYLNSAYSVIVDDTNLNPDHEKTLREIAIGCGATFVVQDFTIVPIDTCISRDKMRLFNVGESVIRQMYDKYLKPKEVKFDPALPRVIICDIDGTLALFGDKNPYYRDFENDGVNEDVIDIVQRVVDQLHGIVYVSGRKKQFHTATTYWLRKNHLPDGPLFMRNDDDNREDSIVKKEIYEREIKGKYNVDFVLDDRNRVVTMWRSLGLTCLQVADGNF